LVGFLEAVTLQSAKPRRFVDHLVGIERSAEERRLSELAGLKLPVA
jgi:hypothetical protein